MTNLINDLTKWVQREVCDTLKFKKPADRGGKEGAGFNYKLVNPQAFPCYCPPQDMANIPTAPSVTIQIDNFIDELAAESEIRIALIFVVWNTGEHDNRGDTPKFTKTLDGWRDLWHFIDAARRAIKSGFNIAGYEITSEITGRPLHGDSAILGTYPYYFGEMTFSIGTVTSHDRKKEIRNLL